MISLFFMFFCYVTQITRISLVPFKKITRKSILIRTLDCYASNTGTASPSGTLTDSWTQTCGTSMGTAADFSNICQTCNFKSRTEIWQDAADTSGINKKSTVAGVSWVDQSIGAIYDFLSENGVLDDTIIIVLSDNGYAKSTLYEWGVRTMMHVRFPNGNISPSTVVDEPVTNLDIVPSILDFIGAQGNVFSKTCFSPGVSSPTQHTCKKVRSRPTD